MYRSSTFILALFFSIVAQAQQSTVDKSTPSVAQTNINISAVAIPMEEAGDILIDSATYHKAVTVGNDWERPVKQIEISSSASHLNEQSISNFQKSEINKEAVSTEVKSVNKSGRAIKNIPKQ